MKYAFCVCAEVSDIITSSVLIFATVTSSFVNGVCAKCFFFFWEKTQIVGNYYDNSGYNTDSNSHVMLWQCQQHYYVSVLMMWCGNFLHLFWCVCVCTNWTHLNCMKEQWFLWILMIDTAGSRLIKNCEICFWSAKHIFNVRHEEEKMENESRLAH